MAEDPAASSQRYRLPSLSDKGALVRLAAIGAGVLAIALCFAFAGGWLSPHRLTQARMIDAFQQVEQRSAWVPPQPRQGRVHRRLFQ